jgi:hypothetical protein
LWRFGGFPFLPRGYRQDVLAAPSGVGLVDIEIGALRGEQRVKKVAEVFAEATTAAGGEQPKAALM